MWTSPSSIQCFRNVMTSCFFGCDRTMPRAFFNPELMAIDMNVSPTPVWSIIIRRRSWRFSLRVFRYPRTDPYSVPSSNCLSRIRSNSLSRLSTTATAEWSSFCPRSTPATKNLGTGEDGAFSDVLKVLIHASSDQRNTEPAIFVVSELCFHLSPPPPWIGGELSPELLKNLELKGPVWFERVQGNLRGVSRSRRSLRRQCTW